MGDQNPDEENLGEGGDNVLRAGKLVLNLSGGGSITFHLIPQWVCVLYGWEGGCDQGYLITHLLTIRPYRILVGSCVRIMCDISKEREATVNCEQCVGERQYQLWVCGFHTLQILRYFPF